MKTLDIPFIEGLERMDYDGMDPESLPSSVRANFYKCADMSAHPHYLSWNPIDTPAPDFHLPEYFGNLVL